MSSHILVLRSFSGLVPGQVLDTSLWAFGRAQSLEEDRFLRPLEIVEADKAIDCGCGVKVLIEAGIHDCPALQAERAEKVAEAQRKAEEAAEAKKTAAPAAPTNATPTNSTPAKAPAKAST